jgi:hypothetical protein
MTTLGYGDYSPVTPYGRFSAVVTALYGITLSSLLLTAMMSTMEFSPNERLASNLVVVRKAREARVAAAVRMLQVNWAIYKQKTKGYTMESFRPIVKRHKGKKEDIVAFLKRKRANRIKDLITAINKLEFLSSGDDAHNVNLNLSYLNTTLTALISKFDAVKTLRKDKRLVVMWSAEAGKNQLVDENRRLRRELVLLKESGAVAMGASLFVHQDSPTTTSPRSRPPPGGVSSLHGALVDSKDSKQQRGDQGKKAMEQLTQAEVLAGEMAGVQDVVLGEEFLSDSD